VEQTERSETSAHKIRTPENHPKETMQHSERDESLKSRKIQQLFVHNRYWTEGCGEHDNV
jgi:hypothetical protein